MTRQGIVETFLVLATFSLTAPFAISFIALVGLAALAALYGMSVAIPLPWIVFFDGPQTAVAFLFADATRYVLFSLLAFLLLVGWLVRWAVQSRRHLLSRPHFYLLLSGIACILGFGWFHQYRPAVNPAPTARLQVVQEPDFLTGIVRHNQVSAEIEGCAFEALGWADANTLVYRQWCGGYYDPNNHYAWKDGAPTPPRAYRVDAKADLPYTDDLALVSRETCAYFSCVRPLLAKDSVHTSSPSPRYPAAQDDPVLSPDGKRVAFRAKHVYGPEDLLVIGQWTND